MGTLNLVLATENPHKLLEFKRILLGVAGVLSLKEISFEEPFPPEGAISFRENAKQKARFLGHKTNLITIADDSGFEVEALKNAPGVLSARYGGTKDEAKQRKLVLEQTRSAADRRARFVCELAYFDPHQNRLECFRGTVEGILALEETGTNGFGYDSIFIPAGHRKTFAEMSAEEKDELSHRGKAILKLKDFLSGL